MDKLMSKVNGVRKAYTNLSFTHLPMVLVSTADLTTDILFVNKLGHSEYKVAQMYFIVALTVIMVATLSNFVSFLVVYTFARNRGCVDDKVFEEMLMPWVLLVAVMAITNPGVMVLLPWTKRIEHFDQFPTQCAYITCSVGSYAKSVRNLARAINDQSRTRFSTHTHNAA